MEETENKNRENLSQESPVQESAAAETATSESTAQKTKKPLKFKLGENLKKLGLMILGVFKDYPVTMIAIVLAALGGSILVTWHNRETEIYVERVIVFLLLTAMQTIAFEEVFPKKKLVRFVGSGVSAVLAALYVYILSFDGKIIFGMDFDVVSENTIKILCVHGVIMLGLSIWHMFRRTEENFEVYATKAFIELLKASVVYGLFALGLALIIWVFNELIFDTDDFLAQVEIFLAGGIYVPMCLKAISGKNETPGKFSRFCILYVLQPMQLLAFAIIYLYIIKLFVTREDTSNKIFLILAFLFSIGMPIWTLIHGLEHKDGIIGKLSPFIPYLFIPFVLLQIWSMGVRIAAYGVTADRYCGVLLILGEILYFVLYFLHHRGNKQAISWTLFVLMAFTFFGLLFPATSFDSVVIRSQMKRLTVMMEEEYPSEGTKSGIKTAYRSIQNVGYKGKRAIEKRLTEEQIATIKEYSEYYYRSNSSRVSLYASRDFTNVDITKYSRIYYFTTYTTTYKNDAISLYVQTNSEDASETTRMELDVSDYLSEIMDTYSDNYDHNFTLIGQGVFHMDERHDVYLTNIDIDYNKETKVVNRVSFHGYVLEK
ncbi:MAG: DUF4153 domain-containing protein [Lachnospiraceae bacterium]|nr:DUF4153 domain-containing protein [Lachnospiraceae bacterium]